MATLLLFRHGETDLTEGRYCGSSDPPLNERGRQQAQCVRSYLRAQTVAAIYSGPLLRAVQTAEPSARALGLDLRAVEALREVSFGEWEGLTFAEARQRYPDEWARREADPYSFAPPGGETYRELCARVLPAFNELVARHRGETIAVFAHRSVNRMLLTSVLDMPVAYYRRIEIAPAALVMLRSLDSGLEVLAINERCHLGLSAGDAARQLNRTD